MYLCIINPIVLLFLRNLSLPQGVSFAGIGGQLHRNIQLFYYNEMDFGYVIRLKSIKKTDSGIEMNYSANIQATQIVIRCFVVVENDTCRLLLGNNFMRNQHFLK